jgi:hypothetical protein
MAFTPGRPAAKTLVILPESPISKNDSGVQHLNKRSIVCQCWKPLLSVHANMTPQSCWTSLTTSLT